MKLSLQHYLETHRASSLAKKIGKSTQLISYWKRDAAKTVYIDYTVSTGNVHRVWAESDFYVREK